MWLTTRRVFKIVFQHFQHPRTQAAALSANGLLQFPRGKTAPAASLQAVQPQNGSKRKFDIVLLEAYLFVSGQGTRLRIRTQSTDPSYPLPHHPAQ